MYSKEDKEMLNDLLESLRKEKIAIEKSATVWRDPVMMGWKLRQCEVLEKAIMDAIGRG